MDQEFFIKEKSEIYSFVLCIMLRNLDAFKYIWSKLSYLWTDLHLALIVNYLFEASWTEGIDYIFSAKATQEMYAAMNEFERKKLIAFCC